MNGADFVVMLVVAFSALFGFTRGVVREVLGMAAWICAGLAAIAFFPTVQPLIRRTIANTDIADPAAYGIVFLVTLIILSVIARIMARGVRNAGFGGLDRTFGLVFGLARGALLVICAYICVGIVDPIAEWPSMVLEARTLPSIYSGATWVAAQVPDVYRPVVPVPPAGRTTNAADLLHATPIGRALAAPPTRP